MNWGLLKTSIILCAVAALVLPSVAQATTLGTVDIAMTGFYANDIMQVWAGGNITGATPDGYVTGTSHSGISMLEKTGGTYEGNLWANGPLGGVCIELAEGPSNDVLTYNVIMLQDGPLPTGFLGGIMGYAKAKYIQELWGRYYDPTWVGGPYTEIKNIYAASFSAAVKEIVHEALPGSPLGWDVTVFGTDGDKGFRCDYDYASLANIMLYSLDGTGPLADLRVFSYDGAQDYLVEVPEPATMALLGFGSLLGLLRRKKTAPK